MPGNAAAGAQAGAMFGPWGAAIGAGAGMLSDVASAAMGGTTASGGGQLDARSLMDSSGWTVSTGRSSARGGDRSGGIDQGGYRLNPAAAVPAVFGWDQGGQEAAQQLQQAAMSPAMLAVLAGVALYLIL